MEKESFEGKWQQMKGKIQKKWGEFTGDEIDQIKGNYDQFVGKVTEKYGKSKDQARDEVNSFIRNFKDSENKH